MLVRTRALIAGLLSAALVTELPASAFGASGVRSAAHIGVTTVAAPVHPPSAIPVREPARITLKPKAIPANAFRVVAQHAARPASGRALSGPPMLRPNQLGRVMEMARRYSAAAHASAVHAPPLMPVRVTPPVTRRAALAPQLVQNCTGGAALVRKANTVVSSPPPDAPSPTPCPTTYTPPPTAPPTSPPTPTPVPVAASGTGIVPWWSYSSNHVPGVGNVFVNVGTGNLVVQNDPDMSVPNKGVPLVFRRTYNTQNASGTVQSAQPMPPSLYGKGWTNAFDAHFVSTSATIKSIYDSDGARYDYSVPAGWVGTTGAVLPPATPGLHTTLAYDGNCGWLWTKPSGTTYYFYIASPTFTCTGFANGLGGYAGRLYQIVGRNANTSVTLTYSWDNGDASATGKVSAITARTQSGLAATLAFADFSGRRLLQSLTYPDGTTSVTYSYDTLGNLTAVWRAPNNATGARPTEAYGYQTLGADSVIYWVGTPRLIASCASVCYSDGEYLAFLFAGAGAASSTVNTIGHVAVVNPVIPDGTNSGPLQSGYSSNAIALLTEYFTTGVPTATLRDTNGHATNWIMDGSARATQIQVVAGATTLVRNMTWDASNNLVIVVDPRGHQADAAYDAAGNVVALAEPAVNENGAVYRPTRLFDYDAFNNVVGSCDQNETNPNGNWNGQYTAGSDSYCASLVGAGNHQRFTYVYPSYEPYGELVATTSPSGYTRTIAYDPASQNGADYGLPTRIYGTSITQLDSTGRQPSRSRTYDANGNVVCDRIDGNNNATTTAYRYDVLNRVVDVADPDDASVPTACSKTPGITGSSIVTHTTYFPNGSVATTQSPAQAAAGAAIAYAYDLDGNLSTQTPTGSPALATNWYDGAGRLVETAQPADPGTSGDYPILLRYIYDLTQGGSSPTLSGTPMAAHGNLYEIQKNAPSGWIDFTFASFDSANRLTKKYAFAPCPMVFDTVNMNQTVFGPIYCSQPAFATTYAWDGSPGPGLLASVTDAIGTERDYTYDADDRVVGASYNFTTQAAMAAALVVGTPLTSYVYDPNGRLSIASSSAGTFTYSYVPEGQLSGVHNDVLGTTTGYTYYPDGALSGISSVTPSLVNLPNLYQYSYRYDGELQRETFGASNQSVAFAYTGAGRPTTTTDFLATPSESRQYDSHGRLSAYTTQAGSYTVSSYDVAGRILGYTATDGETVTSQYNVRGNLVGRTYSPNPTNPATGRPSYPSFQYSNIHGVLVKTSTDQYDGRTGAPLIISGYGLVYDSIGRVSQSGWNSGTKTYSYDAEDRMGRGDASIARGASPCLNGTNAGGGGVTETSYAYDAEGDLTQDVYSDAGGQNTRRWYWENGNSLYTATSHAGGASIVDNLQADGLGVIPSNGAAPGLTVSDLDFDGSEALRHNTTGHSAWHESNPLIPGCVSVNPVAATTGYIEPAVAVPADDGSDNGTSVSSAGRAFLDRANGFTTPDYSSVTPYSASRAPEYSQFNCASGTHLNLVTFQCDPDPPYFPPVPQPGQTNNTCASGAPPPCVIGRVRAKIPGNNPVKQKAATVPTARPRFNLPSGFVCALGPQIYGSIQGLAAANAYPNGDFPPGYDPLDAVSDGISNHPSAQTVQDHAEVVGTAVGGSLVAGGVIATTLSAGTAAPVTAPVIAAGTGIASAAASVKVIATMVDHECK